MNGASPEESLRLILNEVFKAASFELRYNIKFDKNLSISP